MNYRTHRTIRNIIVGWALASALAAQVGVAIYQHERLVEAESRIDQLEEDVNDMPLCPNEGE